MTWQTCLRRCLLSLIPGLVKCKRRSYLLNFELFFCFLLLRKKIIITPGIKHISFDKAINRIGQRKGLKGIGITSKYKQHTYWFITGLWLINRGAFGTKTYFTFSSILILIVKCQNAAASAFTVLLILSEFKVSSWNSKLSLSDSYSPFFYLCRRVQFFDIQLILGATQISWHTLLYL